MIFPRNNEEIEAHREARIVRALKKIDVSLDKVADMPRGGPQEANLQDLVSIMLIYPCVTKEGL